LDILPLRGIQQGGTGYWLLNIEIWLFPLDIGYSLLDIGYSPQAVHSPEFLSLGLQTNPAL